MIKNRSYEGMKVKSKRDFAGVSKGTEGWIIEDYGTGVLIGWNLPDKPWKPVLPIEEYRIENMMAVNPRCPLRDGFDYDELDFLELL